MIDNFFNIWSKAQILHFVQNDKTRPSVIQRSLRRPITWVFILSLLQSCPP